MSVALHRYWFEFDACEAPVGMTLGCGITAFDRDDAIRLLSEAVGVMVPIPTRIVDDVDVSTLDRGHVLPNMHPPSGRGIWFPMLGPYR